MAELPIIINAARARTGAAEAKQAIDSVKAASREASGSVGNLNRDLDSLAAKRAKGSGGGGTYALDESAKGMGSYDLDDGPTKSRDAAKEQIGLQREIRRITGETAFEEENLYKTRDRSNGALRGAAMQQKDLFRTAEQITKTVGGMEIGFAAVRSAMSTVTALSAAARGDWEAVSKSVAEIKNTMGSLPFGVGQAFQLGNAVGEWIFGDQADADKANEATKKIEKDLQVRERALSGIASGVSAGRRILADAQRTQNEAIRDPMERGRANLNLTNDAAIRAIQEARRDAERAAGSGGRKLSDAETKVFDDALRALDGVYRQGLDKLKKTRKETNEEQEREIAEHQSRIKGIEIEGQATRLESQRKFFEAEELQITDAARRAIEAARESARGRKAATDLQVDARRIDADLVNEIGAIEGARDAAIEAARQKDKDRVNPVEELVKNAKEELALAKLTNTEREVAAALLKAEVAAEREKVTLTAAQRRQIETSVRNRQNIEQTREALASNTPGNSITSGIAISDRFTGLAAEFRSQRTPLDKINENTRTAAEALAEINAARKSNINMPTTPNVLN